jgi:hypothetical protein
MNSDLKDLMLKRISENHCVICNNEHSKKPGSPKTIEVNHSVFGVFRICKEHIKVQGE